MALSTGTEQREPSLLETLVRIRRRLQPAPEFSGKPDEDGSNIRGLLVLDAETWEMFRTLAEHEIAEQFFTYRGRTTDVRGFAERLPDFETNSVEIEVTLIPANISVGGRRSYYFHETAELTAKHPTSKPDGSYYVDDIGYLHLQDGEPAAEIPPEIRRYERILALIDLLRATADFEEQRRPQLHLVYVSRGKVSLTTSRYDLRKEIRGLDRVDEIHAAVRQEADGEKCAEIFKSALAELLKHREAGERFEYVLTRFDEEIYARYKDNYQLYLSRFSFDRVQQEFLEHKFAFIKKMNEVLSEIYGKVIVIPGAFLLIATQYDPRLNYKNFALLTAAGVFAYIMLLFLRNQHDLLASIGRDMDDFQRGFEKNYPTLYERFQAHFQDLINMRANQRWRLCTLNFFVWALLIATFGFFAVASGLVPDWPALDPATPVNLP